MNDDCLFCKIASKKIEATLVYEDDDVIAFRDINPQAPVHILFITRKHIATLNDVSAEDSILIAKMMARIKDVAAREDLAEDGYRVVINCNKGAGQEVFHLHAHLLGGRPFAWPPG